jgi:hypothetical protein
VVYCFTVFGLAKNAGVFGLKRLPVIGYETPQRASPGLLALTFLVGVVVVLLVLRATVSGSPVRATFNSWLLQGARLFLLLGLLAALVDTLFFGTVLSQIRSSLAPAVRGAIAGALGLSLYVAAVLIAYLWAQRRIDAR